MGALSPMGPVSLGHPCLLMCMYWWSNVQNQ